MIAILCFYQFWGLFFHCCGETPSQKQWINSLTPRNAPLSASNNLPWLVYVAEACQGIILNQWWILSTASCLIKLKELQSDIPEANDQNYIMFGHKICLHPSFDTQIGTVPIKGNIGVALWQYPVRRKQTLLSHTYNIFQKSCYNCQYRQCRVYQYQNHNNTGTSIKKLSVKLLDLSFCHHHLDLTESKNLCIWSQEQEDCWVQQGSPVLCLFGNHWELVGLVSGPSLACYYPILVIKTAPYLSWIRRFIKASQNPLSSIFSLTCDFSPGIDNSLLNQLSLNKGSTVLTSHGFTLQSHRGRLCTCPLNRKHWDHPAAFFESNNEDYFPGRRPLHFESNQLSSARRLPIAQNSPFAKAWGPSDIADPWSDPVASTSYSWVLSDTQNPPTADIPVPKDLPQGDEMKYQHRTSTGSVRSWVQPSAGVIGFHTLPLVDAGVSLDLFSSDIDGSQISSEITTVQTQIQSGKFPFRGPLIARPRLEIIPDIEPWTYSVSDKVETVMQISSRKETIRTKMHHVAYKVHTAVKQGTYNLQTWVHLIVNENELWTHSTLNAKGYQYGIATHTLNPWLQPVINISGSQESMQKKSIYWILPDSKSTPFWISSTFIIPFTWTPPAANTIRSWVQLKDSVIRPSSEMYRITLLNKQKTSILKLQRKTKDTVWLSYHPITIESFTHSKIDVIKTKTWTQADTFQTWALSETQAEKSLTQLKPDTVRQHLQTKSERITPEFQPNFRIARPITHSKEGRDKYWTQKEAYTTTSCMSNEYKTIRSWNQAKDDIARSLFGTKFYQMSSRTQQDFKTLHTLRFRLKLNTERVLATQFKAGSIQPWTKPETSTFIFWTQSKIDRITRWIRPETDEIRHWLKTQTNTLKIWSKAGFQKVIFWPEPKDDIVRSWLQTQVDSFTPWIETEYQRAYSWIKPEGDIARPWTQSETTNGKHWFQTQTETVTLWTEPVTTLAHHWMWPKMEIVSPWKQPVDYKKRVWIHHDTFTVGPSEENEIDNVQLWTQSEVDKTSPWIQPDMGIINLEPQIDAGSLTLWPHVKETKSITPLNQIEISAVNHWRGMLSKTVTAWTETELIGQKPLIYPAADIVPLWTQTESAAMNFWTQLVDTVTLWTQSEPAEITSWTKTITDIVSMWTQAEFPKVNLWMQSENDTAIIWSQGESQPINSLTQPVADTVKAWTQSESLTVNPWVRSETDKITLWTQDESAVVNHWIDSITGTVTKWSQDKFLIVNSCTQFVADIATLCIPTESPSLHSWTKPETDTVTIWTTKQPLVVNSWRQSETDSYSTWMEKKKTEVNPWAQSETDTVTQPVTDTISSWTQLEFQSINTWTEAETDTVSAWVQVEMLENPWTETTASVDRAWDQEGMSATNVWPQSTAGEHTLRTQAYSVIVSTWTQPVYGSGVQWTQTEPLAVNQLRQTVSCIVTSCIQANFPEVETGTDSLTDTVILWTHTDSPVIITWTKPKALIVTSLTHAESLAVNSCTQKITNIVTLWTNLEIESTKHWTLPETSIFSILLHPQRDTIQSLLKVGNQASLQWTTPEIDNINTRALPESGTLVSWKVFLPQVARFWPQPETPISRFWLKTQTEKIISCCQPQTLVSTLTQDEHDRVELLAHHKTAEILSGIQTKTGISHPWDQVESDTMISWTLPEADVVRTGVRFKAGVINPWTLPRMRNFRPWTQDEYEAVGPWAESKDNELTVLTQSKMQAAKHSTMSDINIVRPWFHTQINARRQETQPEFPLLTTWIDPDWQTTHPWSQDKSYAVRFWTYPRNYLAYPWIQPEGAVNSWMQPETQDGRSLAHPETEIIVSSAIPIIKMKDGSLFKAGIITSFAPHKVEPDGATPLTSYFSSWSGQVHFLPTETTPTPQLYFLMPLSNEVTATERKNQINSLQPSELISISLLTLLSTWLPRRVGYLNFGSTLQITQTKKNHDAPANALSPLSPSSSFPVPCSLSSLCTLSPSCSGLFPCTFPSSCIFPSCSMFSPVAFSPDLFSLASSDSSLHEPPTSKFTEETSLSHAFTSLQDAPATVLTKQPYLMPESQYESRSNQSEQDPLKYLQLSVSLAECHLGLVWNESLQSFWLFKTAVISHDAIECGLRPGLVHHCPDCLVAKVGEFPWMVSVQLSFSHFCAGSILNEYWILTTARCANFIKNSEALALVQVGLIDLQDSTQAQTVGIHHAIPYLSPKGPSGPGLISLKKPLHFQALVLPICMEDSLEQANKIELYDCWLPSWSLMRAGSPGILQKRHISILQITTCEHFRSKQNEFSFCIEAKKTMGEAGCKGDLGAPLVCHVKQKDTWVQVGILSHFDEHCTKPYVFTQVSPFLFWLQGVTQPSHAPWYHQGPMTTSSSTSHSVSTSRNVWTTTSTTASIRPHFISLPQSQTLADWISLHYAMPWQAIIISCGNQICSGSVVSSSWVLTAAHCVRNLNPEDTAVILGLRYPGSPVRVVKVSTILPHERFRLMSGTARNDLALLLLQEVQTPIQVLAPLGHQRNLNSSECWLSGPRILKQGETDENPEMLHIQVMGASSCAHLYPGIGRSIICFITEAKGSHADMEKVSPGGAVMCRPMSGNGSWTQIGFTSLQDQATIIGPHVSWILYTSARAGQPINQALMPWVEKPKSCGLLKQTTTLSLSSVLITALQKHM